MTDTSSDLCVVQECNELLQCVNNAPPSMLCSAVSVTCSNDLPVKQKSNEILGVLDADSLKDLKDAVLDITHAGHHQRMVGV